MGRENDAGLHPLSSEMSKQRLQLRTVTVGNAALRFSWMHALTRLSAGAFSQFDNRRLRRAVSQLLEQRRLAAQLFGSQPDGLLRLVNPGGKSVRTRYETVDVLKVDLALP